MQLIKKHLPALLTYPKIALQFPNRSYKKNINKIDRQLQTDLCKGGRGLKVIEICM